jgi:hypothetical protein
MQSQAWCPLINMIHMVKQQSDGTGSEDTQNRNWSGDAPVKQQRDRSEAGGVATVLSIDEG